MIKFLFPIRKKKTASTNNKHHNGASEIAKKRGKPVSEPLQYDLASSSYLFGEKGSGTGLFSYFE